MTRNRRCQGKGMSARPESTITRKPRARTTRLEANTVTPLNHIHASVRAHVWEGKAPLSPLLQNESRPCDLAKIRQEACFGSPSVSPAAWRRNTCPLLWSKSTCPPHGTCDQAGGRADSTAPPRPDTTSADRSPSEGPGVCSQDPESVQSRQNGLN